MLIPHVTADRTEKIPAITTLSVPEVETKETTAAGLVTLREDARRVRDRFKNELPAVVKSMIDTLPAVLALHSAERLEPKRKQLLAESDERNAEEAPTDK
jgi:hypothetical protein